MHFGNVKLCIQDTPFAVRIGALGNVRQHCQKLVKVLLCISFNVITESYYYYIKEKCVCVKKQPSLSVFFNCRTVNWSSWRKSTTSTRMVRQSQNRYPFWGLHYFYCFVVTKKMSFRTTCRIKLSNSRTELVLIFLHLAGAIGLHSPLPWSYTV